MSLKELLAMVTVDNGRIQKKVSLKDFNEMTSPVLFQSNIENAEIIVRKNGYVLYSRICNGKRRKTIFHISRMYINEYSAYHEEKPFNASTHEEFLAMDAAQVIMICGEMRFMNNDSMKWEKYNGQSLDDQGSYNGKANDTITRPLDCEYQDLSDIFISQDNSKEIIDAMNQLTDIQLSVIIENVLYGVSCNEIARCTGKNPKTVSECRNAALKRLADLLKDFY